MRIQFNQSALNNYRQQGIQGKVISKSMERLSSGVHINRAADDAAGLAISEKMRGQIRGLEKAQKNIQDGISLINVADGASAEIHAILQRARELAVQAANDTNQVDDRMIIQKEINQLITEIDHIANGTEFNTMSLLNGLNTSKTGPSSVRNLTDVVGSENITSTGGITETYEIDGKNYASASVDFSNLENFDDVKLLEGTGLHYTCGTCAMTYNIKFVNGTSNNTNMHGKHKLMEVDISSLTDGEEVVNAILATAYNKEGFVYDPSLSRTVNLQPLGNPPFVNHFSQLAADGKKLHIYDYRPERYGVEYPTQQRRGVFEPILYQEFTRKEEVFNFLKIQTGANEEQNMTLRLPNLTTEQLQLNEVLVTSQMLADDAISQIDRAINIVSDARKEFGAYQNRLEYTHNNVAIATENLANAESTLRDTDMADEISRLQAKQVLLQAAQAMGAQANQQIQGILQLLQ